MNTPPLCRVSGLRLAIGARVLVAELSLLVQAGERWAVLGPNGAGKSTLLQVLAGVRAPHAGEMALQGHAVRPHDALALAPRRALMLDRWSDPFAATVEDTVRTGRYRFGDNNGSARVIVAEALATFDLTALASHDVRTLSRGERQRVALATTLVQDTPLVLLDEPTAHQDPRHAALVLRALRAPALAARAIVASLHDVNAAAAFATHALLLDGHGGATAGSATALLTAERLSAIYRTPVDALPSADGTPRFALAL